MIHLRFARAFQMGIKSLRLHPLRSMLTALSVVCGVGAVIAMLAIGEGASFRAQEQFRSLGSNTIVIESIKRAVTKESQETNPIDRYGLTRLDLVQIHETIPDVELSVPVRDFRKDVWHKSRRYTDGKIVGTEYFFADVQNYKLARGRWICATDGVRGRLNQVVVLGSDVCAKLFPLEDPLGQTVSIGTKTFTVVGVMANQGGVVERKKLNLADLSKNVYMPLSTLSAYFGNIEVVRGSGTETRELVELKQIIARVADLEQVLPRAGAITHLLEKNHPEGDFRVVVPLKEIRQAQESARNFTLLLFSIGAVSLLVGGIGIMNIMLATVTERTREIGIRRALGARKIHIVMQFLIETLVLTTLGGLIGVLFGVCSPWWVPVIFRGQIAIVRVMTIVPSFLISAGVGILFGLYPAWRAANMDPIEALRHEWRAIEPGVVAWASCPWFSVTGETPVLRIGE
ncbi:MAG: ABC transporter permease [Phycisphaerae bacterium]|nr:ABC transporter permease [Phycisphaerae bacterium]